MIQFIFNVEKENVVMSKEDRIKFNNAVLEKEQTLKEIKNIIYNNIVWKDTEEKSLNVKINEEEGPLLKVICNFPCFSVDNFSLTEQLTDYFKELTKGKVDGPLLLTMTLEGDTVVDSSCAFMII